MKRKLIVFSLVTMTSLALASQALAGTTGKIWW